MGIRSALDSLFRRLVRVKALDLTGNQPAEEVPGKLPKCLSTMDLVSLGVGSCMGTGMYVVSGLVARQLAGPAVIISFTIAAMASILSGVCYAEFGVRVPKTTGSAYMYSYVTVGEFTAFVIGWNLILEYLIGTAAGASALSGCLDSLFRSRISTFMMNNVGGFGIHTKTYPDLVALIIAVAVTLVVAAGVKKSITFNNILNALNLAVWVFMVVGGLFFADGQNWSKEGFMPYGFSGVMTGAATCFYAFIGFDIIATTGEEAKNPSRSIPLAIMSSLVICLVAYVSVSFVLTLAVPFEQIGVSSPLMDMFVQNNAEAGKYIVAIGAIAGLMVSLLGSLFPMPRVIYAMASDGLLFRFLARVNAITHTPAWATIISGFLAAILALLVSLADLIEMMSIGTLLAYTLVSMSVLILRYQPHVEIETVLNTTVAYATFDNEFDEDGIQKADGQPPETAEPHSTLHEAGDDTLLPKLNQDHTSLPKPTYGAVDPEEDQFRQYNKWTYAYSRVREYSYIIYAKTRILLRIPETTALPTAETGRTVTMTTIVLFVMYFIFNTIIIFGKDNKRSWWCVIIIMIVFAGILACIWNILRQPQNPDKLPFMAPCVPLIPFLGMFVNVYLMLKLSPLTWIRFAIWMVAGMVIYFGYGMWNSNIEARYHDTTRQTDGSKEAIVMDSKNVQMPTAPSFIPAHARSGASLEHDQEELMSDQQPPGAPAFDLK
ncbi:solute carrier family 7 member 14-like [Amphiura filiformis]|uniref:solute carrier family 7 member 14-like n=1 Tax=Amphiura filiformis TaxID=82378 RepID=UPI003B20EED5